ncbi:DinB family protein [Peribacillus saganii]|uniref:DinB family protein n=1 Tax=Peribacillus saganii TaxID=2303992 RepID=UPI0013146D77|nr:DinB family protein [Peribacillus saganii]
MANTKLLFSYHNWATNRLLDFIADNSPEVFNEGVESVFSSIGETFSHIYTVDQLWFNRITRTEGGAAPAVFTDANDAKNEINKLYQLMEDFLKDADLSKKIAYKNSAGTEFQNKTDDIFIHLTNHGTYHRGNITAMLWELGKKSISTDYIFYLREIGKHDPCFTNL